MSFLVACTKGPGTIPPRCMSRSSCEVDAYMFANAIGNIISRHCHILYAKCKQIISQFVGLTIDVTTYNVKVGSIKYKLVFPIQ